MKDPCSDLNPNVSNYDSNSSKTCSVFCPDCSSDPAQLSATSIILLIYSEGCCTIYIGFQNPFGLWTYYKYENKTLHIGGSNLSSS